MKHHRFRLAPTFAFPTLVIAGCLSPARPARLDPIGMHDAAAIVNRNIDRISGTLRASGVADGYFTVPDGPRRSYHLDATLFYLAPAYFRLDLKKFGDRQILFGSNDEYYWVYNKEDDAYYCGRHGIPDDLPPDIPVRPGQIVDALGLTPIPPSTPTGDSAGQVQRIVEDYQQILFIEHGEGGGLVLEKEYWLDRFAPRLLRRVVFRDADGVVEMKSDLDEYKPVASGGPLLPRLILAEWPKSDARLRFRARTWTIEQQVGPDGIQFATPRECRQDPDARPST